MDTPAIAAMELSRFRGTTVEVRLMIWRLALPEQQRKVPLLITSKDLGAITRGAFRPGSSPPLLRVNRESREVALKHYGHRRGEFFRIDPYLNLQADTVFTTAIDVELIRFLRKPFLQDLDLPGFKGPSPSSWTRNRCEFHRVSGSYPCYNYLNVSQADLDRIERLSIGILVRDRWEVGDPWHHKNMSYVSHIGRCFPSVKHLTIEIVGIDPAWKGKQHRAR